MYAAQIDYHRACSVQEAICLLQEHEDAKIIAGGHSLIPLLKFRLSDAATLVDIGRLDELKGISRSNGCVSIGALTTHAELASSDVLMDACPILPEAAGLIGDPQVRNRGTVGGNLAHADPGSDLPTVLVALGAEISAVGPSGERTIAAADFFRGLMSTALGEDEVLTSVSVPVAQSGQGMAYAKYLHPASRYAVVGAAAVLTASGDSCTAASVAVGGLTASATKAPSVECAVTCNGLGADALCEAASQIGNDLGDDLLGDVMASAGYRLKMAGVYVGRALACAAERAQ